MSGLIEALNDPRKGEENRRTLAAFLKSRETKAEKAEGLAELEWYLEGLKERTGKTWTTPEGIYWTEPKGIGRQFGRSHLRAVAVASDGETRRIFWSGKGWRKS